MRGGAKCGAVRLLKLSFQEPLPKKYHEDAEASSLATQAAAPRMLSRGYRARASNVSYVTQIKCVLSLRP